MPFYEFYCGKCDKVKEKLVKMGTKTIDCPLCGGKMYKIMSPTTFILKGRGWANDSYGLKKECKKCNKTKCNKDK